MKLMRAIRTTYGSLVAIGVMGVCFLVVATYLVRPQVFLNLKEDVVFLADPSAATAFAYAERHFNATDPAHYDMGRAEYYFNKAISIDPHYPAAYHELARIAFLKNDLYVAHVYINKELDVNPSPSPATYYIRALIKAYRKDYLGAAGDYEIYFTKTPANWAGMNDYAWVLLQANLPDRALEALDWALAEWPDNAWLLNNRATALYELGRYEESVRDALAAKPSVEALTVADWLTAYPGNDPLIAPQGLAAFKEAASQNLALILKKGVADTQ